MVRGYLKANCVHLVPFRYVSVITDNNNIVWFVGKVNNIIWRFISTLRIPSLVYDTQKKGVLSHPKKRLVKDEITKFGNINKWAIKVLALIPQDFFDFPR